MYEYQAQCITVVDGDTIDVVVDLGFHLRREIRLRLVDVDTHETYGVSKDSEEYRRGKEEAAFVKDWLAEAAAALENKGESGSEREYEWPLRIRTEKAGKYGRYIATVERKADGEILNDALLETFDDVES